jgi:RNA polymerase sigma-70 factor (ECF subfamily)
VRRYARSPDDARDLAQRAFLKAFQAARRARWLRAEGAVPFRAWILRIAVNLGRNHLRDALRWRRAPAAAAERLPVAAVGTAALERAERERAVRVAVLGLPRRQREVLTLRVDAELSFREVAEVLGITELNARVHFHHAARRLRDVVAGEEKP